MQVRPYTSFYYDPQRQGYDTDLWKSITSAPTISSNKLRFNAATAIQYADCTKGIFEFKMTVPAAPTTGDVRQFGLMSLNRSMYAVFDITDDVFSVKTKDALGSTKSTTITWDSTWTNAAISFTIQWIGFDVVFKVNNRRMARHEEKTPTGPVSAYIKNGNSDNMDMTYLEGKNIEAYV